MFDSINTINSFLNSITLPSDKISFLMFVLTVVTVIINFFNNKKNREHNREVMAKCNEQSALGTLFSTFDRASEITINNPELLYSVHGISKEIPLEEVKAIAYLCLLIDGYQQIYGYEKEGCKKMYENLTNNPDFLVRLLCVSDNQRRWDIIKETYYGPFDKEFTNAIDNIITYSRKFQK